MKIDLRIHRQGPAIATRWRSPPRTAADGYFACVGGQARHWPAAPWRGRGGGVFLPGGLSEAQFRGQQDVVQRIAPRRQPGDWKTKAISGQASLGGRPALDAGRRRSAAGRP